MADERDALIERYQRCAVQLWQLFPRDPLPADDPAQSWIERLEALLARGLLTRCVGVVVGHCPAPQIRCHQGCTYADDNGEPQSLRDGLRSWACWEVVGIGPVNLGSGLVGSGAQADYESGRKRLVMRQGFVLDLVPVDYQLQEHEQFVAVERVTKHESWPTPR